MAEHRTLWIHVPPDYNATSNTYPVLYLLDGDSHFDYAARTADFLAGYDRNRIPPMIVVGVVNVDRGRDFTPVYSKKPDGSLDSSKVLTDAGAGRFLRYLEEEVTPYIDAHYRVQPYRILAAHSLGGLFALYAKETRQQLFPGMILTSPVISDQELHNLKTFLIAGHPHNGKLFFGIGNENTVKVYALAAGLKRQAPEWFDWSNKKYEDENHFTAPFKTLFDGLKFIYRDWFIDFYGNENLTLQDINKRFAKLSTEFGYTINPGEEFLNNCGYYQLRLKHIDNAIGIFAENVKRHPYSFNTYDSLGEAYMDAGNKQLAIINYKKSIELNPHNDGGKQMLEKLEHSKP
ncbi:MAG TPA: alpha/beta hydrolase-fold protein [Mucilaginibacter sp.]|nr:alpha/beta hydrolase-fold protein [Mucilaginibacter sp.]